MTTDTQRAISVILADDHTVIREAIAEMLESEDGIDVLGQVENGADAVSLAKDLRPDVVLLDVEMPIMGAEGAIDQIIDVSPTSRVVILTMHEDAGLLQDFFSRGISAYLVKTVSRAELISTVKSVARGDDRVVLYLSRDALYRSRGKDRTGLSERELEILLYVARGMSNNQIARRLYLTEGTVKRHLHRIYTKTSVSSRGEATSKALREGWITLRDIAQADR